MKIIKGLFVLTILLASRFAHAQESETRQLDDFTQLEAGGSIDVEITQGNENSAYVEAENVALSKVITKVDGDALIIKMERGSYRNTRVHVKVTYKELNDISGSGSGDLVCKSDFKVSRFRMSNSGSGNLTVDATVEAEDLSVSLSGSGDIDIDEVQSEKLDLSMSGSADIEIGKGLATLFSIDKSGSGDLEASDLESEECKVSMSGSGNADVFASKTIEGSISGSGNIKYRGDASVSNFKVSGSGEISKN